MPGSKHALAPNDWTTKDHAIVPNAVLFLSMLENRLSDAADGDGYTDLEEYLNVPAARDSDHDGKLDHRDNCPRTANAGQRDDDLSADGFGDARLRLRWRRGL